MYKRQEDPLIGDPNALKGGTFYFYIEDYPLTFRLMGPNSNDAFAGWNRAFTMDFTLTRLHPVTDRFIPCMATHWSVQPDRKTVYYRLDPDARWSDGKPITADDYVFCWEMMRSKHIVDPFYRRYAENYFESVEAVEPYVLKIVGKRPSWRPLYDYSLWPMPRHAIKLGPDWVKRENNKWQVAPGPYVVTEAVEGERVVFCLTGPDNMGSFHLNCVSCRGRRHIYPILFRSQNHPGDGDSFLYRSCGFHSS